MIQLLSALFLLFSQQAAMADSSPDLPALTRTPVSIPFTSQTVSCEHTEDAITDATLEWKGLSPLALLPNPETSLKAWGINYCEQEIPAMLKAAAENGGVLNATLEIKVRVEKEWSNFFGCNLNTVETDTLEFELKDRTGIPMRFETGNSQLIKKLTPADCGVKN
jgi:hypothetical protein